MKRLAMSVAAALLLAACGGGGGSGSVDAPPPVGGTQVPDEASLSVGRLVAWLSGLARDDGAEPLGMGGFAPQAPDHTEPENLS